MSDVISTRAALLRRAEFRSRTRRRWPAGYGLALGAAVSIGLWAGLLWAAIAIV